MSATTLLPDLVHERAAELGALPVEEITAELESRIRARHGAPAGFHLKLTVNDVKELLADPDYSGEWDGPTIQLEDSKITTCWNSENGISFFVDHEDDNPWPISKAGALASAIQSIAKMTMPDYDPTILATAEPASSPMVANFNLNEQRGAAK
ncbi:hypothetical protein AOC05_05080 [Arthrobacter alpinus]|uniref:Uncharacterized protein n=1 Tax=Arthrobacter alpinus TaxID=656366 RepID=A0A0M4RMV9_9MICC|nr:hypothetical protein [Arthrobacter alpinus]ALE91846.1 hypothetical protein AOC05_05080 [Arthrobacter alpinus]